MRAASSSSRGTSRTKTPISHSAIGRLSVVCARIRPVKRVVEPDRARTCVNQAPASAIGGIMWKTSAQPRKTWTTQRGQRMRCSDQAAERRDGEAEQRCWRSPTIRELR